MLNRMLHARATILRAREALTRTGGRERDLENIEALARAAVDFDWLYTFSTVDRLGERTHRLVAYAAGGLVFVSTNGLGSTVGLEGERQALERELEASADVQSWDAFAIPAPKEEDA